MIPILFAILAVLVLILATLTLIWAGLTCFRIEVREFRALFPPLEVDQHDEAVRKLCRDTERKIKWKHEVDS
jgi:hypothetical protein